MGISFLLCCFASCLPMGLGFALGSGNPGVGFDQNYAITWGQDHALKLDQGREVQLSLDRSSGAGFASKASYGSGFFHMRVKAPGKDSAGVVTAFYLSSPGDRRDELDFEFLGNREGKPITLQTNVYANGVGGREQRFLLWFDPTAEFHDYSILWNQHQMVFFVDKIPIRVVENNERNKESYPSKPMHVNASMWNGEAWATDGGREKIDWSKAPFTAHFQGFHIAGCPVDPQSSDIQVCGSFMYWWNSQSYWKLSRPQQKAYGIARRHFLTYDYCSDKSRYPIAPKECLDG